MEFERQHLIERLLLFTSGRNSAPNGVINMHIRITKKDQSSKITFKIFINNFFFKTIHESNTEEAFVLPYLFLHKCTLQKEKNK